MSLIQGPSLCPPELSLLITPSCLLGNACHCQAVMKASLAPLPLCSQRQAPWHFSKGFSANHLGKQPQETVLTLRMFQGLDGDLCSFVLVALSWLPSCLAAGSPVSPSLTPEDTCYQALTGSMSVVSGQMGQYPLLWPLLTQDRQP